MTADFSEERRMISFDENTFDVDHFAALLGILRANGVRTFSIGEVRVEFGAPAAATEAEAPKIETTETKREDDSHLLFAAVQG